jgi:signal transduction histidine kinase/CheY-like chemotaxis protein
MKKNYASKRYWLSITTILVFSWLSLLLYNYFSKSITDQIKNQLQVTGEVAARNFELSISKNYLYLKNAAQQMKGQPDLEQKWDSLSKQLISRNNNIVFTALMDEKGDLMANYPNDLVQNSPNGLRAFLNKELKNKDSVSAPHIKWLNQIDNGHILLLNIPIELHNPPRTILAGVDMGAELQTINDFLSDYAFQLKDETGKVIYSHNALAMETLDSPFLFKSELVIEEDGMHHWSINLFYQDSQMYAHSFMALDWMLVFGILLSLLMGLLLFFYLESLEVVRNSELGNQQLVRVNIELEDQRQKAQKASNAKTEFLSNMSHEIRTPLNAILGICELLNTNKSKAEKDDYINMMQESSKTLLRLVNDVLAIDRIESGNEHLSKDRFEPCAIVENLISFYSPQIESKKLELVTELKSCERNLVVGDRTKFEQISLNLFSNAIKFTHEGRIDFTCEERVINDSQVAITLIIKDTGIGIPATKQETIFDRFTQLDVGIRKKHSGGGLGLYITRQLVNLMHGSICVESKEGVGSQFSVTLELPLATDREKVISENFVEKLKSLQLNVLAVDDNKLNMIILTKLLKNMGMNTDVAYNGEEALKHTAAKNYDIIFMDVHMPEMDGYEATRHIRKRDKNALILGLSADATTSSIQEGLYVGMDEYLTKPLDLEKLATILMKHFEGQLV